MDSFGWKIFMIALILVAGFLVVEGVRAQPGIEWWHAHYSDNCGWLAHCYTYTGTVTSVHDYEVQCTGGWDTQSSCPREDLTVRIPNMPRQGYDTPVSFTLNCHFYQVGQSAQVKEKIDYFPIHNETQISWSVVGGPC